MRISVFITTGFLLLAAASRALAGNCAPCDEFSKLNTMVRDNLMAPVAARDKIRLLVPRLHEFYLQNASGEFIKGEWTFPLAGYTPLSAGNERGRDYVASGYDYFSGNRHGGHPSYDLFIRDRNRDCRDDRTGASVNVLSMTGGLVVATADDWQTGSRLRGGNYIWIYEPTTDGLVYYAHNGSIKVAVGDIVKPGDPIATVGRSGLNAYRKRSPTHLHLTYLKIRDGHPKPVQISWQWLRK